jgi:chromosome segregation ATPase
MKEILGLLFLVCVSAVTIHLSATKQIEWKLTLVFFTVGLAGGFMIARFDGGGLGRKDDAGDAAIEKRFAALKEQLLSESKRDDAGEKEGLRLALAEAQSLRQKLEAQLKAVEEIGARAEARGGKPEQQATRIEGLERQIAAADERSRTVEANAQAAQTAIKRLETQVNAAEARFLEVNRAHRDLALVMAKMTWLQTAAKDDPSTLRVKAALAEIDNELNRLLEIAIPDRATRNLWAQKLVTSLPKAPGS